MYQNTGEFPLVDRSAEWGFSTDSYSNGAAYADLDNDGDLDLLINNIDQQAFLYRNHLRERDSSQHFLRIRLEGPPGNRAGFGARLRIQLGEQQQSRYVSPYRGYLSTVEPDLHFGLGSAAEVDRLIVDWPDGRQQVLKQVKADQVLSLAYAQAGERMINQRPLQDALFEEVGAERGLLYRHREKDFVDFKVQAILPHKHSQNGPGIAVGDINGDGLDDCFMGGAEGYEGRFFVQQPDGRFAEQEAEMESGHEDMGSLLFDADGDGDNDLYVVSGGSSFQPDAPLYQDRLYINDGSGHFNLAQDALPQMRVSGATVSATDFDRDGDLDLFVGGRVVPGAYPMPARSFLLQNESLDGRVIFRDVTADRLPEMEKGGLVCAALWTDFDRDGWTDLMVAGEWMPITFFRNDQGDFTNVTDQSGLKHSRGWWNSLVAGDFDADGDTDYLAGNLGLNTRYNASPEQPVCIYAKDYDKNGRIDPVLCHYIEDKNYIAHSRDMLIEQINSMKGRFKTYDAYGAATFERSFTKEELADAYVVKSETFASSYIENKGNGRFEMKALPMKAQVAPIFGMLSGDFNSDGHPDALLVGNSYSTEIGIGQYDACKGILLAGTGKGEFSSIPVSRTGFLVNGDAKSLALLLSAKNEVLVLAGRNNDQTKSLHCKAAKISRAVSIDPSERYALIEMEDGSQRMEEFYYGSTYLSQSTRKLLIPEKARSVRIYKDKVTFRTIQ